MRICDLKEEQLKVGLRIKSLVSAKRGTIVEIDVDDDHYSWVLWDGDQEPFSGFYGNNCQCEVVEDEG